ILVTAYGTASRQRGRHPGRPAAPRCLPGGPGPVPADRPAPRRPGRPGPGPRHLDRLPARGRVRRPGLAIALTVIRTGTPEAAVDVPAVRPGHGTDRAGGDGGTDVREGGADAQVGGAVVVEVPGRQPEPERVDKRDRAAGLRLREGLGAGGGEPGAGRAVE